MATFALIPGAGGNPWEWHRLTRDLEGRGHEVVPVQLPAGDDRAGWSEYVVAIGERRDVVLVAQSLAGFTAPLVAARVPVDLIVLLNAMIPLPGRDRERLVGEHPATRGRAGLRRQRRPAARDRR